jgi:hypothetical protein
MRFGLTAHPGFESRSLRGISRGPCGGAYPVDSPVGADSSVTTSARSSTDRALDYGSRGCRFESCRARRMSPGITGSSAGFPTHWIDNAGLGPQKVRSSARRVNRIGHLVQLIGEQLAVQVERIVTDWWPSIVCTTFTFASAAVSRSLGQTCAARGRAVRRAALALSTTWCSRSTSEPLQRPRTISRTGCSPAANPDDESPVRTSDTASSRAASTPATGEVGCRRLGTPDRSGERSRSQWSVTAPWTG